MPITPHILTARSRLAISCYFKRIELSARDGQCVHNQQDLSFTVELLTHSYWRFLLHADRFKQHSETPNGLVWNCHTRVAHFIGPWWLDWISLAELHSSHATPFYGFVNLVILFIGTSCNTCHSIWYTFKILLTGCHTHVTSVIYWC
jgi:hypothetical protein